MPYCDVGSLESLSVFGRAEEVVVGGTLLATAVLQVEGEQAGEAGAASTSCQQGGHGLFKDGRGAASRDQEQFRLQRAHRIHIRPRVHGHLVDKRVDVFLLMSQTNIKSTGTDIYKSDISQLMFKQEGVVKVQMICTPLQKH